MPEKTIQLTGVNAVIAIVVLMVVIGIRIATFNNNTDEDLHQALTTRLMSEFYPNQVDRMKAALAEKDSGRMQSGIQDVLDAKLDIVSVQTSHPFLDFSSPRDIVVKVRYDLDDGSGVREKYYLYRWGAIGNSWQYQYESSVVSYYLNFM